REVVEDELVGRKALGAEVAADRSVVDHDAVLREPERHGHLIAQIEGRLVRRNDLHAIAFEPHDRGTRLERRLVDARRRELVLEDPRRACEGGLYIAVSLDDVALVIRMRNGGPLAATFEEPVRTARTPTSALARAVSTETIRACGYGLRTNATSRAPGTLRSAVYAAAPVVFASPSIRRSGRSRRSGWINAPRPSRGGIPRIRR